MIDQYPPLWLVAIFVAILIIVAIDIRSKGWH